MNQGLHEYDGMPTEQEINRDTYVAQQRAERFSRATDRINSLVVTETSGSIRATVDMSGALRSIEFEPRATRMGVGAAVQQITACVQRAQARIPDVARQVLAAELPGDPSAELAVGRLRQRYPTTEPPPEPEPPARPRRERGDEDWAEQPIMRRD